MNRDEWVLITRENAAKYFSSIPGLRVPPGTRGEPKDLEIHRSHLPLVPEEALKTILPIYLDSGIFVSHQDLDYKLRDYQVECRDFIRSRYGSINALPMRAGKTPTIVSSHNMTEGKFFVIGPKSARGVWLGWMRKRWPDQGCNIVHLEGRTPDMQAIDEAHAIFIHYDVLPSWQFLNRKLGTVVLDEGHYISNRKSKRTQAALTITTQAQARVIVATGTPIWNAPADMYPLLSAVNPGAWGNYYDFARRYGNGRMGIYGFKAEGTSNEEEFKARMREVMFHRTNEQIYEQVPEITRSVETVHLSVEDRIKIDKDLEIDRKKATTSKLRTVIGDGARFRRLIAQYKTKVAIEHAQEILDGGESVVIWTWHVDVCDQIATILHDIGYKAFRIHGGIPTGVRDSSLADWNETNPGALVISLAVGATAIDLSHARHCIFAELDHTPAVVAQAERRTFTSTRPMTATYITSDFWLDTAITKAILKKCKLADNLGVPCAETAFEILKEAIDDFSMSELDLLAGLFS